MKTKEQITEAVNKLGVKIRTNKNSLKELHKHLNADEEILSLVDGVYLAVLTNERFMSLNTSIFTPTDVKEVALKNISNIEFDAGLLTSTLKVSSVGMVIEIVLGKQDEGIRLKNEINAAIANVNNQTSPSVDIVSQIERLAELKEKGLITETEFAEQKKKILAQSL